jgi:hypothetical protein
MESRPKIGKTATMNNNNAIVTTTPEELVQKSKGLKYRYFVMTTTGEPIHCPRRHLAKYFDTILEMTGYDQRTANAVLTSGIAINAQSATALRFFAVPLLTPSTEGLPIQ